GRRLLRARVPRVRNRARVRDARAGGHGAADACGLRRAVRAGACRLGERVVRRWIALLRGVNVGGGNKIAMPALRVSCEGCGFERVSTYIQSGNLVFDAPGDEASVTASLRKVLADEHGLKVPVVVRTAKEM